MIVLWYKCDDNMNFDIGLEEMLQPITKETSSRQNGVEKWNKQVFMNIIVLDIYVINCSKL
jgi:hypothetical protein